MKIASFRLGEERFKSIYIIDDMAFNENLIDEYLETKVLEEHPELKGNKDSVSETPEYQNLEKRVEEVDFYYWKWPINKIKKVETIYYYLGENQAFDKEVVLENLERIAIDLFPELNDIEDEISETPQFDELWKKIRQIEFYNWKWPVKEEEKDEYIELEEEDLDQYDEFMDDEEEDLDQYDELMNDKIFIFNKKTNTIVGVQDNNTVLRIPREFDNIPVHYIQDRAFEENENIKEVIMPDSIKGIGEYAFSGCEIEKIKFSKSLEYINQEAFYMCKLKELYIPDSVKTIGNNAFKFNPLTKVYLSKSLEYIGEEAFSSTYEGAIKDLKIPDSVTHIGDRAFSNSGLEKVYLSKSLEHIGNAAFERNKIRDLNIPDSVIHIGGSAFRNNLIEIESVIIGKNVEYIGENAFKYSNIKKITILGDRTRFNSNWKSIGFPKNLKPIKDINDLKNKISEIEKLRDEGIITEEDFFLKLKEIMNKH